MTPRQYRQANGATYPVIVAILGYFVLTLLAFVFVSGGNARTWAQLIVAVLAIVISTIAFIAKRDTKVCAVILMASSAAAYAVICIFNTTPGTYVYSIPILLASMAYSNARMVMLGNIVVIISNIVRILMTWSNDSATQTAAFVSMFSLILMMYASVTASKLLKKFNEENTESIKEAAALQEDNHITQIIGELNEGTRQANISIEESAQSVNEQNDMIQNTQKRFEDINEEMLRLSQNIQETEESMKVIVESTGIISDNISQLSASSEEVAAASSEGLKTSENAVQNMNKCKAILESICLLAQDLKEQA